MAKWGQNQPTDIYNWYILVPFCLFWGVGKATVRPSGLVFLKGLFGCSSGFSGFWPTDSIREYSDQSRFDPLIPADGRHPILAVARSGLNV